MAALLEHQSPWAGTWYPGDAFELRELLETTGRISAERTGGYTRPGALAFIVPHAAPSYSGVVASAVYRHLRASRVVVLGFSHRMRIQGIAIPEVDQIQTPLGAIRIDRDAVRKLTSQAPFRLVPDEAVRDHSVEVQIPFLQLHAPDAEIVPLYVGELDESERRDAAVVLRECLDGNTVLVASSDLTHYGADFRYVPFPHDESTGERLRRLDMSVLSAASSLDQRLFEEQLRRTGSTVCGSAPIRLLLETLRELPVEVYQETLDYETSGELTHDFEHSVSYGAIGYFPESSFRLEAAACAALLDSAKETLERFRVTGEVRLPEGVGDASLLQRCRAFVTLFSEGAVRGCIGRFEEPLVLAEGVPQLALDAFEDRRFEPARAGSPLDVEVHILTPPKRIRGPEQFRVGLDGAYLKAGTRGGLLLPGVAGRYHLSHRRFMEELARKASLPDTIYTTDNYELYTFHDQTFPDNLESAV